jgi:hypothetical protein
MAELKGRRLALDDGGRPVVDDGGRLVYVDADTGARLDDENSTPLPPADEN